MNIEEIVEHPAAGNVLSFIPTLAANPLINKDGSFNMGNINNLSNDQKELIAFCLDHWGQEVVADLWQLQVLGAMVIKGKGYNPKFRKDRQENIIMPGEVKTDKDGKVTSISGMITIERFLEVNSRFEQAGRYYVYKDKETMLARKAREKDKIARQETEKKQNENKKMLAEGLDALKTAATSRKSNPKEVGLLFGVDDKFKLYEGLTEADEEDYLILGTEEECKQYIADNKPAEKKSWGVDHDYILCQNVLPEEKGNYLFTGSKSECNAFIKANKK